MAKSCNEILLDWFRLLMYPWLRLTGLEAEPEPAPLQWGFDEPFTCTKLAGTGAYAKCKPDCTYPYCQYCAKHRFTEKEDGICPDCNDPGRPDWLDNVIG